MDSFEDPLKKLLASTVHLPYNEYDMEEAYELGKRVLLDSLLNFRATITDGYTLYDVINLDKAKKEVEELCEKDL